MNQLVWDPGTTEGLCFPVWPSVRVFLFSSVAACPSGSGRAVVRERTVRHPGMAAGSVCHTYSHTQPQLCSCPTMRECWGLALVLVLRET